MKVLNTTLNAFMADDSPLSSMDDAAMKDKECLEQWYGVVKKTQADVSEYFRLKKEADLLQARKSEREKELTSLVAQLKEATDKAEEINDDIDTAGEMLEFWKRWTENALRVAGFREKVVAREASIQSVTSDERDLKTVNEDIAKLEKEKDEHIGKMNALNKEMTEINDAMSHNAQKATQLEKYYRDMQDKYDEELQLGERKEALKAKQKSLKKEIDQVGMCFIFLPLFHTICFVGLAASLFASLSFVKRFNSFRIRSPRRRSPLRKKNETSLRARNSWTNRRLRYPRQPFSSLQASRN